MRGGAFPYLAFLIDCDSRAVNALIAHIKRYALRSKLTVTDVSDSMRVIQAWGPSASSLWGNYVEVCVLCVFSGLLCRLLKKNNNMKPTTASKYPPGSIVPKESFVDVGLSQ